MLAGVGASQMVEARRAHLEPLMAPTGGWSTAAYAGCEGATGSSRCARPAGASRSVRSSHRTPANEPRMCDTTGEEAHLEAVSE